MGGCKCSYVSCKRNSDRKTHFFHYPVRHQERCLQWMVNSNRLDYQSLQLSQLKNKVVCQYHFEDKMFINYKHDRLVYNAVPIPESNPVKDEYLVPKIIEDENKKLDLPNDSTFEKNSKEESMMSVIMSPITGLSFISPVEKKKKCAAPYIELLTRKHNVVSSLESQKSISVSTPMRNITSSPKEVCYKSPFSKYGNANKQAKPNTAPVNNTPLTVTNPSTNIKSNNKKSTNVKNITSKTPLIRQKNQSVDNSNKNQTDENTIIDISDNNVQNPNISRACPEKPIIHNVISINSTSCGIVTPKSHILTPPQTSQIKSERIVSQMKVLPLISKTRSATSKDIAASKLTHNIERSIRPVNNRVNILDVVEVKSSLSRVPFNSASQSVEVQTNDNTTQQQDDCMKLIQENSKEILELKKQISEQQNTNKSASKRSFDMDDNEDDNLKKALLYAQIVPFLTPKLAKKVHAEMFPSMAKKRKT